MVLESKFYASIFRKFARRLQYSHRFIDSRLNATVEESVVRLEVQLPFAAMAFRGKIEQTMKGELEKILG